ncbi:MAG: radical SAM protein [Lachnospiraceae bacterium]|nr:radical SAM protein [Lachnospiraceae bacterium]
MYKFDKLTVCLDMYGCANRCRHCRLGFSPKKDMNETVLVTVAKKFGPFTRKLEICDWYREPDYNKGYKWLWQLTTALSDNKKVHSQQVNCWRAVRDEEYIPWLKSLGLKTGLITLYGNSMTTDYYIGRKGAYSDTLRTMDFLIKNGIAPCLQIYVNKDSIRELADIAELLKENNYEYRCQRFGGRFSVYIKQGVCDGENVKLYDLRLTSDDVDRIPEYLINETKRYMRAKNTEEIFGKTGGELFRELTADKSTENLAEKSPVFYVDNNLDVFPSISAPTPSWHLGNLKYSDINDIVKNYTENRTKAQRVRLNTPISEIVGAVGNPNCDRLFKREDYIIYMLNKYCKETNG